MPPSKKPPSLSNFSFKVLLLSLLAVTTLGICATFDIDPAIEWLVSLRHHPAQAGAAIVALYVLASIFLLPGSIILTCASGMIFGFWIGLLVIWTGGSLGVIAVLLLSQLGPRKWAGRIVSRHPLFEAIDKEVQELGWKAVILLRLVPVVPTRVLNYLLVLTSIDAFTYLWSSILGIIPLKAFYTYLGTVLTSLSEIKNIEQTRSLIIVELVGVLLLIIVSVVLSRRIRRRMTHCS